MKKTEELIDDPVKMVRAIRDRIHEETKEMSREEYIRYIDDLNESARRKMDTITVDDYDFSFLERKERS